VLLVEEGLPSIANSISASFWIARRVAQYLWRPRPAVMDIEEVAARTPEKDHERDDRSGGAFDRSRQGTRVRSGIPSTLIGQAVKFMQALYTALSRWTRR